MSRSRKRDRILVLLLFCAHPASGTTIVVKFEKTRVLIAADTRADTSGPHLAEAKHQIADDRCKVLSLGRTGASMIGLVDYHQAEPSDTIADWNAMSDAKLAYSAIGDDTQKIATEWAQRSVLHYQEFYREVPSRVSALASGNAQHVLDAAIFVSWKNQAPLFIVEVVTLDATRLLPISSAELTPPITDAERSLNSFTQELIDGETDRAKDVAKRWDMETKKFPPSELAWRHLEFLIEETSKIDPTVSPSSDILEIPIDGKPSWITKSACNE